MLLRGSSGDDAGAAGEADTEAKHRGRRVWSLWP